MLTRNNAPFFLHEGHKDLTFPDPNLALSEPDGLLAIGGDLKPERILEAYKQGIFPWYSDDEPILWWSPNPRMVIYPEQLHISKSLKKSLKKSSYRITFDTYFEAVIRACAGTTRNRQDGTWITPELLAAYTALHHAGVAHSIEVWNGSQLVGGLYGLAIGQVFFGESMFSKESNTSKMAMVFLCELLLKWQYQLIDCQVHTNHLSSLGAINIPRTEFLAHIETWVVTPPSANAWNKVR